MLFSKSRCFRKGYDVVSSLQDPKMSVIEESN